MLKKKLGNYLCESLYNAGISKIFGVAGDYNFTILDEIEKDNRLTFIENRNELNASYAADGYARINGIGAIITTFGVGELSAFNGIAGSYSENVPIVHIVGAPSSIDQSEHRLMHHSLMNGDFQQFKNAYQEITSYATIVTLENAEMEISKALFIAKSKKKPVYIMIPNDLIQKDITISDISFNYPQTNKETLKEALKRIKEMLEKSSRIVLLSDVLTTRFHLENKVQALAEHLNLPVATTVYGKGSFNETHPNYIGLYAGLAGSVEIKEFVENADTIIAVGLVYADTNTGIFTNNLNFNKTIQIQPNYVKIGEAIYPGILAKDIIEEIINLDIASKELIYKPTFPYSKIDFFENDLLAANNYYPIFEQFLCPDDIVLVDTGTLLDGFSEVRLKKNITYITQGGYQSIGYATPATLGAIIANQHRRTILFTGDGSLQMTFQEISTMFKEDVKPIIIILNNGLYLVEDYLNVNTKNPSYNILPKWNYQKTPEIFNGEAYTEKVKTVKELIDALKIAQKEYTTKLCIIEIIPGSPYDVPEYLIKTRDILEEQAKRDS